MSASISKESYLLVQGGCSLSLSPPLHPPLPHSCNVQTTKVPGTRMGRWCLLLLGFQQQLTLGAATCVCSGGRLTNKDPQTARSVPPRWFLSTENGCWPHFTNSFYQRWLGQFQTLPNQIFPTLGYSPEMRLFLSLIWTHLGDIVGSVPDTTIKQMTQYSRSHNVGGFLEHMKDTFTLQCRLLIVQWHYVSKTTCTATF